MKRRDEDEAGITCEAERVAREKDRSLPLRQLRFLLPAEHRDAYEK